MRPGTILYRGRELLEPVLQLHGFVYVDGESGASKEMVNGPDLPPEGKDIKHFDLYEVRRGKIVREIES